MSLFSKLLKAATDKDIDLEKLAKNVTDAAEKLGNKVENTLKESGAIDQLKKLGEELEAAEKADCTAEKNAAIASEAKAGGTAPAGTYWGELMPEEENQYTFDGSWEQYFKMIFEEDFPEYCISEEVNYGVKSFIFSRDGGKDLVVEMLSKKNNAQAVRNACRKERIPYLRFYYDVPGWWNVRAYVVDRIRKAL